jgi:hypothetical protein
MAVFEDDKEKLVEQPKEEVVEEPPKKTKRKRKPLSASKKAALVERLKLAREKKKANRDKEKTSVPTPKKAPAQSAQPTKVEPPKPTYREKQLEIQNLRDELEIQKLKNELDNMKKSKAKNDKMIDEILTEPQPPKQTPKVVVNETPAVAKVIEKAPPPPPKKITHSLRAQNIWGMF